MGYDEYFVWLCELAGVDDPPIDGTFWALAKILDAMEFYAIVPHDENRERDGHDLRAVYFYETGRIVDSKLRPFCSVLEMIVAFCIRLERDVTYRAYDDDHTKRWIWEMIDNAGLMYFCDTNMTEENANLARDKIYYILDRNYEADGCGGFFPLRRPYTDQRQLELWYQADAYISENFDW